MTFKLSQSILFMALATLLGILVAPQVFAQTFKPEQLRASFLYHIVHYTNYPAEKRRPRASKVHFCFLEAGKPRHSTIFKDWRQKKIREKDIDLVHISNIEHLEQHDCELLFVDKDAESDAIFDRLSSLNKEMVSVGETRDFVERGGMVTIVPLQSKMKIFLSREQYERSPLKFSSLLLKRVSFK